MLTQYIQRNFIIFPSMRKKTFYSTWTIIALLLLASCHHDDADAPIKPAAERTILLLTSEGHIYDQTGKRVAELPNCEYATEIINDEGDYFVSGKSTKDRVGYWKNGKWNTLHVDFIDDVEHETQGIGKWDYYIFMYDHPHILRNSGIFPLEDPDIFNSLSKCMAVSEGKCYLVGWNYYPEEEKPNDPVLYYEKGGRYVKKILPKTSDDVDAVAFSIFAYDGKHTVIGGQMGLEPCIWVDEQLQMLPRTFNNQSNIYDMPLANVSSVACTKNHIYAAGSENDEEMNEVATLWVDGFPRHLTSGEKGLSWSWIPEIIAYGDDLYALSIEIIDHGEDDSDAYVLIWLNGNIVAKYSGLDIVNFTVI